MKKVFLKMKNQNRFHFVINLVVITLFTICTYSCSKDDDGGKQPVIADEISEEIKELIFYKGDEKASTVLINVQGGPAPVLDEDTVDWLIETFNTTGILTVTVHQAQTKNSNLLLGNEITLNEAASFNTESIEILYKTIKYFKDEGRTVYVVGASFGAFITQELIAQKGIDVADKFLIISGRLDINEVFWQGLADGRNAEFENGVTPVVAPEPFDNVFNRNEARLFAAIVKNRYTQEFNAIESLSNLTYIYGETDEAVGSLTAVEVAFLESKNANILSGSGGHDEPFEDFIEQGFSEAFDIEALQ
ncbi:hypothetical protein [Hyunsoonleella pacifica]|uniref:Alpha/beta hydrolase n=1 Tax=Hyunsoonleella pacifica TaxID=1080224 RepID=A0A4Q9FRQ9_9FLAO|nr:hypothetical protein [Hyunsoonleella pacifica]TBN17797.1 hypothetical protein EYD46_05655 [Hyunsoonleella pacifica]GGD08889.1 hypothetical protein GCM10011368_08510 [Hyunsoonleella pacifica]